jgi:DNA-binding IclR family transcriptional regulator
VLQALAKEPRKSITEEYRRANGLPPDATVRKAIRTLSEDELVVRDDEGYRVSEPFFAEWILRFES